jgi:hypothetical protein
LAFAGAFALGEATFLGEALAFFVGEEAGDAFGDALGLGLGDALGDESFSAAAGLRPRLGAALAFLPPKYPKVKIMITANINQIN